MKRLICISIIIVFLSISQSFGQSITLSADSVTTLLCKKWEVDYAMIGNMKIGKMPGATEMNFEFNKDKTLTMTGSDPKDKTKGTWVYDTKKKIIKLTINGRSHSSIISIREGELVMLTDTKESTPSDPEPIHLYLKIKGD